MTRFALGVIRRKLFDTTDVVPAFYYRWMQAWNGVWIDRSARVLGSKGIVLGRRTVIHGGVIIAAGSLSAGDTTYSRPDGQIRLGEDCHVLPGAILAAYGGFIIIENEVSINPGAILYGHGGLRIGAQTRIAANAVLIPANHVFSDPRKPIMLQGLTQKGIHIGSDVWIGAGARVLDGVTVGNGSVLAAGCVVTKDVKPLSVVAGVPARLIAVRGGANVAGVELE